MLNKFSPIGASDPVRDLDDDPLLYIVRHYQPHKVFLFYTQQMQEKRKGRKC